MGSGRWPGTAADWIAWHVGCPPQSGVRSADVSGTEIAALVVNLAIAVATAPAAIAARPIAAAAHGLEVDVLLYQTALTAL